jgi:hypothetical protein
MSLRMGRMTKRNRAKYRRRAYEAGMVRQTAPGHPAIPGAQSCAPEPAPPLTASGQSRGPI